jgi:hypothetical protein
MSTLTCPYCYEGFAKKRILFRCSGLIGPTGKQCKATRDKVLFDRFGIQDALPPTFTGDGKQRSAVHELCGCRTHHRVCPYCHSRLPVDFGWIDNRLIAMIGAKESGKTVYMTVLLHELMHGVGRRFDAAMDGCDDHTLNQFSQGFEHDLYEQSVLPATTQSSGAKTMQPLVYRVSLPRQGRLLGKRDKHTITSFFDTAGEDLTSRSSVDLNTRYLGAADGVILLLDPLQMRGARDRATPDTPMPGKGDGHDTPFNVLSRVTALLREKGEVGADKKIKVPIAVAFSKMDALWDSFTPDSPLLQEAPGDLPALDVADTEAVHDYVRALLHEWDGGQIDQFLRANYVTYSYFGLSALGAVPRDRRVAGDGIRPHRVEDPYLWLLGRFNIIATHRS